MDIRIQAKGNKSTALAKAAASPARAYFLTAESLKEHRGGEEHIFLEVSKEPLVKHSQAAPMPHTELGSAGITHLCSKQQI